MDYKLITSDSGTAERLNAPLDVKIFIAKQRIIDWYEYWDGQVYIALSGGKDSTVLADLVWSIYPDVPAVFCNTGLEYPEIVQFVKAMKKAGRPIEIVRPKRTFRDVVLNDGFPLVSKKVAMMVRRIQSPTPNNKASRNLYLTGYKMDGTYSRNSKIPDKWMKLVDAPFKTTEICCDVLKKEPLLRYQKSTGRRPYIGMMREEGGMRGTLTECNAYESKIPQSRPLLPWSEENIWEYIKSYNIDYCGIYDDRKVDGRLVKGETRTGCMFCAFGAHLEEGDTRFQKMAITHPKLWNYCVNRLGMGVALDYIGVKYLPEKSYQQDLFTDADRQD